MVRLAAQIKVLGVLVVIALIVSVSLATIVRADEDFSSGLQLYYSFDNAGDLAHDDSGNGNNGILGGTVVPTASTTALKAGGAVFNRTGLSRIDVATSTLLGTSYTKSVWVYITAPAGGGSGIISHPTKTNRQHYLAHTGASTIVAANSYHITQPSISEPFVTGRWMHVAVTYDQSTQTLKLYKDGTLATSTTNVSPVTVESDRSILIGSLATSGTSRTFPGVLDELRIYTRALSAEQVLALYEHDLGGTEQPPQQTAPAASGVSIQGTLESGSVLMGVYTYSDAEGDAEGTSIYKWMRGANVQGPFTAIAGATSTAYELTQDDLGMYLVFEVTPVAATGTQVGQPAQNIPLLIPEEDVVGEDIESELQLHYAFNDASNLGYDSSGNGFHGTPGGTILPQASSTETRGLAAHFYRSGFSKIDVPTTALLGTSYTKAAWLYIQQPAGGGAGIIAHPTKTNRQHIVGLTSAYTLSAANSNHSTQPKVSITLTPYVWTHIVTTYDQTTQTLALYKDGVLATSTTNVSSVTLESDRTMLIGSFATGGGSTRTFGGVLDEIRVYTRALTPGQVAALYQHELTPTPIGEQAPLAQNVTIRGSSGLTATLRASYNYVDLNSDLEGASMFRWLRSATTTGSFTPIPGATQGRYTIQAADNGQYIAVEVTPKAASGSIIGSSVLSAPRLVYTSGQTDFFHLLATGQSLSVGKGPAVSITQPYTNLMLAEGFDIFNQIIDVGPFLPLLNNSREAPHVAEANTITGFSANQGVTRRIISTGHGVGGQKYSNIKKGTEPYARGIAQARAAMNEVENVHNGNYRPLAISLVHGESDAAAGTTNYDQNIAEMQQDYQNDLNVLTERNDIIPLFFNQASQIAPHRGAVAQLKAHRTYDNVYLTGPIYQYEFVADRLHLSGAGGRSLGEQIGKVMYDVLVEGIDWSPLMPVEITRTGTTVYVEYHVPVGPIQFDTTRVAERTSKGFMYWVDGVSQTIQSVEIVSADTIKIELANTPTGSVEELSYAINPAYGTGSYGSPMLATAYGGNVRDSDTRMAPGLTSSGAPLYNWAVAFRDPVLVIPN